MSLQTLLHESPPDPYLRTNSAPDRRFGHLHPFPRVAVSREF